MLSHAVAVEYMYVLILIAKPSTHIKAIPIFCLLFVKIVSYRKGIRTIITRSTAINIKWLTETRTKKRNAIFVASLNFSSLFHDLESRIEHIVALDKLNKKSETDKLARIISYILFLRLILAIKMISTIFNMAISKLVARLILLFSFSFLFMTFRCGLCLMLSSYILYIVYFGQIPILLSPVCFIKQFFRN